MSKSFTVASAKGGVGKTTTTANLGAALAAAGHDVVLVDADIGMANLGALLGIVPDGPTLHDVLSGEATLEETLYEGPCGMRVVPGSVELEDYAGVDPAMLRDVVDTLSEFDGYVLVDSSAGLSHDSSLPLAVGDGTLLVSTPDRASLLDTEKTRELTTRLGGTVVGVALTRVEPDHPMLQSAPEVLGAEVIAEIPEDDAVTTAAAEQEPLEVHAPRSSAAASYRELARELTGAEIPEPEPEAEPEPESVPVSDGDSASEDETDVDPVAEAAEDSETEQEARSDADPELELEESEDEQEDLELEESEDEQEDLELEESEDEQEDLELEEPEDEQEDLELEEPEEESEPEAESDPAEPELDLDADSPEETDEPASVSDPDAAAAETGSEDEVELEEPIPEADSEEGDDGSAESEPEAEPAEEETAESTGELAEPIPDAEPGDAQGGSSDVEEESDESDPDEGDGETAVEEAVEEEPEDAEEQAEAAEEEPEEKRGFFSRLLGR